MKDEKIWLVLHPFHAKLPLFTSFLSHLNPAISGEILGWKHQLPRSKMFYPTLGIADKVSKYLPTCSGTSADFTMVVAELRSGPGTFLLALEQVLIAQKGFKYLPTCAWTIADFTLVVVELKSGPCTFLLALEHVLTLPWWWENSEVVTVPSYLCWNKCWLYPGGGRAQKWSLYLPTCTGTSADSTLVLA